MGKEDKGEGEGRRESERHNGISYELARWADRDQEEINNRNGGWGKGEHI